LANGFGLVLRRERPQSRFDHLGCACHSRARYAQSQLRARAWRILPVRLAQPLEGVVIRGAHPFLQGRQEPGSRPIVDPSVPPPRLGCALGRAVPARPRAGLVTPRHFLPMSLTPGSGHVLERPSGRRAPLDLGNSRAFMDLSTERATNLSYHLRPRERGLRG
jgi:hypothetical protein